MAEEEFQESDVIFSDHHEHNNNSRFDDYYTYQEITAGGGGGGCRNNKKLKMKSSSCSRKSISVPMSINIPDNIFQFMNMEDQFEEEEYDDDGEIIPPHVIIGRRIAGKMAFSVCSGNGRTLKGRDLSHVRNSILRMTGFLEP